MEIEKVPFVHPDNHPTKTHNQTGLANQEGTDSKAVVKESKVQAYFHKLMNQNSMKQLNRSKCAYKKEKADTDVRTGRKQAEAYYCALATNTIKQIQLLRRKTQIESQLRINQGLGNPELCMETLFSTRGKRIWLGSRRWQRGCHVRSSIGADNGCSG